MSDEAHNAAPLDRVGLDRLALDFAAIAEVALRVGGTSDTAVGDAMPEVEGTADAVLEAEALDVVGVAVSTEGSAHHAGLRSTSVDSSGVEVLEVVVEVPVSAEVDVSSSEAEDVVLAVAIEEDSTDDMTASARDRELSPDHEASDEVSTVEGATVESAIVEESSVEESSVEEATDGEATDGEATDGEATAEDAALEAATAGAAPEDAVPLDTEAPRDVETPSAAAFATSAVETGDGTTDAEVLRSTRRRWMGRSGIAVGGAASLAVGAVLGGAFDGISPLLPPASAVASPKLVSGSGSQNPSGPPPPLSFGGHRLTQLASLTTPPGVAAPPGAQLAGVPVEGSGPITSTPGSGAVPVTNAPALDGSGGASLPSGSPAASPSASQSQDPLGQVLATVSQLSSQLPVVGSTASGAVGAVAGAVGANAPAPSPAAPSSTTPAPVVQTVLQCANGVVVQNLSSCPVGSTSVLGGL
jgi:hypothetical protein